MKDGIFSVSTENARKAIKLIKEEEDKAVSRRMAEILVTTIGLGIYTDLYYEEQS